MTGSPPASLRLFLALWPPPALLPALVARADAWTWPAQARRTPRERLHITLHFLGNVDAQSVPRLREGLGLDWSGCELRLDRAEVWPGGIAVLEASEVPPALGELHARLAQRLQALGIATETRRYRPHLTLARKATGARPAGGEPLSWQAGPRYALVCSLGGGRGYDTLQSFG